MALTGEQRTRVDAALASEDGAEASALIRGMDSAEQLHALMGEYNWDDGFHVPTLVLTHRLCERATALLMYYDAQGPWSEPDPETEHGAFLSKVQERLLSGELPEATVSYHPPLNRVETYKLRRKGVPEEFLRACGPR